MSLRNGVHFSVNTTGLQDACERWRGEGGEGKGGGRRRVRRKGDGGKEREEGGREEQGREERGPRKGEKKG